MSITRDFTSGSPPQLDRVTSSTPTILITHAVSAGDLIVAAFAFENATATLSLADTSGNTWVQAGTYIRDTNSPSTSCIFYCLSAHAASASTNTLTLTISTSVLISGGVHSYNSPGATWSLDKQTGTSGTTGTSFSTASVTTTSANEALVCVAYGDQSHLVNGSGWTYQYEHLPVGNLQFEGTEDQIATSTGSFAGTWTQNLTGNWSVMMATFAATTSGGASGPFQAPQDPIAFSTPF